MKKLLSIILLSLPTLLLGQEHNLDKKSSIGDLDLKVYNYIYVDSLGNNFSERDSTGAKGSYDLLKIRTVGNTTTFTFNLREDNRRRTLTNLEETYTYKILESHSGNKSEYWVLEREDGVRLTFGYNRQYQSYSLTIPIDKLEKKSYIYVFTDTKGSKTTFNYSFHGNYTPQTNDYSVNMNIDSAANVVLYVNPEKTKIIVTANSDTLFNHHIYNVEYDNDGYTTYSTTNYVYEAVFMYNKSEGVTMLYDWVEQTEQVSMHYKHKYFWSNN